MAHFIVEYSSNLDDELNVPGLLCCLRDAAEATGIFPLGGIRVRAHRCADFVVADGDEANAFVHLAVKAGHGRSEADLKAAAEPIFAALTAFLEPLYASRPLGISFELTELPAVLNFRRNNIHEYLRDKG